MKKIILVLTVLAASLTTFARPCEFNDKNERDWVSQCDISGTTTGLKDCLRVAKQGSTTESIKYVFEINKSNWPILTTHTGESHCDISASECSQLTQKFLKEASYTDQCKQNAKVVKVKYEYKVLNADTLKLVKVQEGKFKKN